MSFGNEVLSDLFAEQEEVVEDVPEDIGPSKSQLRFTIKKFILQALLEKSVRLVPSKDVLPVLKNFYFSATSNRLEIVASNLELSLVTATEMVEVAHPGVAVFPAAKLLSILKEANEGDVVIDVSNQDKASVSIGTTEWSLRLQPAYDFPTMPNVEQLDYFRVDRVQFVDAMLAVKYAVGKDPSRPSLMMVNIVGGKMTACDSVRFQQVDLGEVTLPARLQIPASAVEEILRLLKTLELEYIYIAQTGDEPGSYSKLIFKIGTDLFIINKLMSTFPDVEQLLLRPALSNTLKLSVDKSALLGAVKRVCINADRETAAIGLLLSPNKITVTTKDRHDNGAREEVEAEWSGTTRMIVVNHGYLVDMLTMYPDEICRFFLSDDSKSRKSPLLLRDDSSKVVGITQQMLGRFEGFNG